MPSTDGRVWQTVCDCCGRRRKCQRVGTDSWSPDYCLAECLALTTDERTTKREEMREHRRQTRPRLAYPCIGGPLDGQHADTRDFYDGGMYDHLDGQYVDYNSAGYGSRRIGGRPTMVFIHHTLLKPLISAKDR